MLGLRPFQDKIELVHLLSRCMTRVHQSMRIKILRITWFESLISYLSIASLLSSRHLCQSFFSSVSVLLNSKTQMLNQWCVSIFEKNTQVSTLVSIVWEHHLSSRAFLFPHENTTLYLEKWSCRFEHALRLSTIASKTCRSPMLSGTAQKSYSHSRSASHVNHCPLLYVWISRRWPHWISSRHSSIVQWVSHTDICMLDPHIAFIICRSTSHDIGFIAELSNASKIPLASDVQSMLIDVGRRKDGGRPSRRAIVVLNKEHSFSSLREKGEDG